MGRLAGSIKSYGVQQPIGVTPRDGRYMIIWGERRFRASRIAGIREIPAKIIEATDALIEELALLENIQHEDLNYIEQAEAYQKLIDRGTTKEQLAQKMGFKQVWRIDERLALLKLTDDIKKLVMTGEVRPLDAFHIARVPANRQHVVLSAIKSGRIRTLAQVMRFVDGLLATQDTLFALQSATAGEMNTIHDFELSLAQIARFLARLTDEQRIDHLKKMAFHSSVATEEIDAVIASLQKIRLTVLSGMGLKQAKESI